jgi:FK506-binding protein 1
MGVTKSNTTVGDGATKAKKGDTITMEYTGWLQDTSKDDHKGKQSVFTSHERYAR